MLILHLPVEHGNPGMVLDNYSILLFDKFPRRDIPFLMLGKQNKVSMRDTKTKNDHPHSFPLKLLKHLRPHNLSYGHETCSYLIQNISEAGNVYFGNNHTFTQSGWPQRHEVYGLDILIKIAGREFPAMIWQKKR